MTYRSYISFLIIALSCLLFSGCATESRKVVEAGAPSLVDISSGLPQEGLWRENIVLYDMNGDGFLDIVAPPPRKAKEGWRRPFIFMWDSEGKKWSEMQSAFPEGNYSYGGIAVGDLDGDGYPDLALAQHGGDIVLFMNDKGKGFVAEKLPLSQKFHSRALTLADINGDGRLDLIAASEAGFESSYRPLGILAGVNKDGKGWETKVIGGGAGLFGDSIAAGDMRGSGQKDIAFAVLTSIKQDQKLIWFGDGKGDFRSYEGELFAEAVVPVIARSCDMDGDGRAEAVFGLAQIGEGEKAKGRVAVLKWNGEGFTDIASGFDQGGYLVALDTVDLDGDGRCELLVLTEKGLDIYKYKGGTEWNKERHYPVSIADVSNTTDMRAGRNKDGSAIVVFNLGKYEGEGRKQGLKAYLLK